MTDCIYLNDSFASVRRAVDENTRSRNDKLLNILPHGFRRAYSGLKINDDKFLLRSETTREQAVLLSVSVTVFLGT